MAGSVLGNAERGVPTGGLTFELSFTISRLRQLIAGGVGVADAGVQAPCGAITLKEFTLTLKSSVALDRPSPMSDCGPHCIRRDTWRGDRVVECA